MTVSYTTCVTVATSRNSFPDPGYPTNFDKIVAISGKIATRVLAGGLQTFMVSNIQSAQHTRHLFVYMQSHQHLSAPYKKQGLSLGNCL